MHNERKNKHQVEEAVPSGAIPSYLMDRTGVSSAKVIGDIFYQIL
jgi:hypothetical protein